MRGQDDSKTTIETKTRPWDSAEHLASNEDIVAYSDAVLAENDPALLTYALGGVARARGMTELAREIAFACPYQLERAPMATL